MLPHASSQAAAEYVGVTGRSALQTFEVASGNALQYVQSNPAIIVVLGVLAILLIWFTRPRRI